MDKLAGKIMEANFGRLLKGWVIAALVAVLLGSGVSAALLAPQIREAVGTGQAVQRQENLPDDKRSYIKRHDRDDYAGRVKPKAIFRAALNRPSAGAIVSVGVTALLWGLLALAFWLLVAAWLYQAAARSGMSGSLWGGLGLGLNVFAAVPFAVIRSFRRRKCPACGSWQDKEAAYCAACGCAMSRSCPACGGPCPAEARFCSACGVKLENAGEKGEGWSGA